MSLLLEEERKHTFNLGHISSARGLLFFVATAMIMIFHSPLQFHNPVIEFLKEYANLGVDVFLFLSGFGLYYSFSRDPNWLSFYKKRAIRILPCLILVSAIWYLLINHSGIREWIYHASLLAFFREGDRIYWFFAVLIPLYIAYPVIHWILEKLHSIGAVLMVAAVVVFCVVFSRFYPTLFSFWEIAIARIPVFICGAWMAPAIKQGKTISTVWIWVSLAAFIARNAVMYLLPVNVTVERFLFWPLAVSVVMMVSWLDGKLKHGAVYRALVWLGGLSMEIYLLQERVLYFLRPYMSGIDDRNLILTIVLWSITVPLAVVLQQVCALITRGLKGKTKHV